MGQVKKQKSAKFTMLAAAYNATSPWSLSSAGQPLMTTTIYALDDKGRVWKMVTLNAVDKWVEVPHAEAPL